MGFWGILWELARVVVPHAAPHVARAVADAAKERRAGSGTTSQSTGQPTNQSLADAIAYLERRVSAAEEKAADSEEKLLAAERDMAVRWQYTRKLVIALVGWNLVVTAALIVLVIYTVLHR